MMMAQLVVDASPSARRWRVLSSLPLLLLSISITVQPGRAAPTHHSRRDGGDDPFAVLDPQDWVNPDDMTWEAFVAPPGTNWSDPTRKGSERNFNIALVAVDYENQPFVLTLTEDESTVFGNPQPGAPKLAHDEVTTFYRDFLNAPSDVNGGHTLHEYWMEDSGGRFGVDLTAFGAYRLPGLSYHYGITDDMNPDSCPAGETCSRSIRGDALGAWRDDVGDDVADSYELVFLLSAGQDESSSWQEFGEMMFQTKEDVPDEFGPPGNSSNSTNYANTRYVDWTSWAAAASIWPNAYNGSSTQSESSGMATFAHELSHLLDIPDNYNNPFGDPPRRSYTGPWSMLSRGSFNGPGGPHTRWQIPPRQGGAMGCQHTVRDKAQIGLVAEKSVLQLSREALPGSGPVVAKLTARAVDPGDDGLMGIQVSMDEDRSPACDVETDPLCDGGGYDRYNLEVIDRMGADSFTPDAGVMISKTKDDASGQETFQWTLDANPQDIELVDFERPDGTPVMITVGDYRQLSDALFHAGTRSGSEFEYVDEANALHIYVVDVHRDEAGVLSYTTAVRSLDGGDDDGHQREVHVGDGKVESGGGGSDNTPTNRGVTCSFDLSNSGSSSSSSTSSGEDGPQHPLDVSAYLNSDIYRLEASVIKGDGWKVELPNALATAECGGDAVAVKVAVGAEDDASLWSLVELTATSDSDTSVSASGDCWVNRDGHDK